MKRLVALALVAVAAAGCSVPGGPGRGAPFSKSKQERDRRGEEEPRRSPRSVQLFDVRRAERAVELEVGPVWYRKAEPTREGYERGTGELLLGVATTSRWKPFYLSGVPDARWDNDQLRTLGRLTGADFEFVDASSLQVAPNSYEATTAS